MSAPEFLVQATQGWARLYGDSHVVSTGVRFVHLAGLLVAGGMAMAADRATLVAARRDDAERASALGRLATVHTLVMGGLAMMFVSGALMLLADVETFWDTNVFWAKMALIALLLVNGLLMRQAEGRARTAPHKAWTQLRATSVASAVLWILIVLASTVLGAS
jgi:hypothetical protein